MNETSLPQSSTEIFMSPDGVPDCVNATDASDAETMCSSLCQTKNEVYEQEANNSASKNWVPFNCGDLDDFTTARRSCSRCQRGHPAAGIDTLDALLAARREELESGLPGAVRVDAEGTTLLAGLPARTLEFSFSDHATRFGEQWALVLDTAES